MAKQFVNFKLGPRGGARWRGKLDGRPYILDAIWLPLERVWSLTILDGNANVLRSGLWLRHGEDVIDPFTASTAPGKGRGRLRVWDTSRRQQDPGRDDLRRGSAVRLIYIPASERVG